MCSDPTVCHCLGTVSYQEELGNLEKWQRLHGHSLAGQTLSGEGESLVTLIYPTCAQRSGFSSECDVVGGFRPVVTT